MASIEYSHFGMVWGDAIPYKAVWMASSVNKVDLNVRKTSNEVAGQKKARRSRAHNTHLHDETSRGGIDRRVLR